MDIYIFLISVLTNFRLFRMIHFQNVHNEIAMTTNMGHSQNQVQFSSEITKGDHKPLRTFHFIQM